MRMSTALRALQMTIRLDALVLLVLGVLFWTGNALTLIPLHMLLGLLLVLLLWAMAGLAATRKAPIGLVAGAVVWGLIVLWLGLTQTSLLPGSMHWIIEVLHLLVGIGAVGLAEMLGARVRRAEAVTAG
jgi:hypothetical protein